MQFDHVLDANEMYMEQILQIKTVLEFQFVIFYLHALSPYLVVKI